MTFRPEEDSESITDKAKKSVSLVLGSGGARGLAHVGVIHWLTKQNYDIKAISGSSMGALVGGIYAAGKLNEFEEWVRAIKKVDIVSLLDLSWGQGGLVKGDKIINTLAELVGRRQIEDLPIPFTAVAADIKNRKEVWIKKGPLFDAIRASISIPLVLTPVRYKDLYLIDGGVLNPVPIAPTFGDATDLTIAVNLGGPPMSPEDRPKKKVENKKDSGSIFQDKIEAFIDRLYLSDYHQDKEERGMYDIANLAFDTMQGSIARSKLAAYPPDILVDVPRNACNMMEFDMANEIIDLGYKLARDIIPKNT